MPELPGSRTVQRSTLFTIRRIPDTPIVQRISELMARREFEMAGRALYFRYTLTLWARPVNTR